MSLLSQGDSLLGSYIWVLLPVAFLDCCDPVWLMHWSLIPAGCCSCGAVPHWQTLHWKKQNKKKVDLTAVCVCLCAHLTVDAAVAGTLVSVPLTYWISPCWHSLIDWYVLMWPFFHSLEWKQKHTRQNKVTLNIIQELDKKDQAPSHVCMLNMKLQAFKVNLSMALSLETRGSLA